MYSNCSWSSKQFPLNYISLLGNIQYAGQMTSGVAQPQSPSTAKTEMNPGVLVQNSTAGHVQVVDSSHIVTSAGDANHSNNNSNRSRGRGGRGRGKSSGRGRRSTSGPGPEIDHNIEVRGASHPPPYTQLFPPSSQGCQIIDYILSFVENIYLGFGRDDNSIPFFAHWLLCWKVWQG